MIAPQLNLLPMLLSPLLCAAAVAAPAPPDHVHDGPGDAELGHERAGPHHAHPHFTHPLVTESPLPENQARFDAGFARGPDADEYSVEASVEFALTPNVGVELALPYGWVDPEEEGGTDGIGNAAVAVKYADYRFSDAGFVLGAGLELELPTGDDEAGTGDDRQLVCEPNVAVGYRSGPLEVIGVLRFGIPLNEPESDAADVDLEVGADLSLLYHFTPRVAGMLEFNGTAVVAGASDETLLTINPGLSLDPIGNGRLRLGIGAGVPVTDDAESDWEARTMLIVHF
jgi:hypothetical protein